MNSINYSNLYFLTFCSEKPEFANKTNENIFLFHLVYDKIPLLTFCSSNTFTEVSLQLINRSKLSIIRIVYTIYNHVVIYLEGNDNGTYYQRQQVLCIKYN